MSTKRDLEAEMDWCRRNKIPVPDPVPHPADILPNFAEHTVEIIGPRTVEERKICMDAAGLRDRLVDEFEDGETLYRLPVRERCALLERITKINQRLPPRLRRDPVLPRRPFPLNLDEDDPDPSAAEPPDSGSDRR